MGAPRTPQNTMTNMVYPTPDSIRFRLETIKPLNPTCLPVEDDHRASNGEYEWLPSGTASKRPRESNDPIYRPTGGDQQLDDEYKWLLSGTRRPRNFNANDPTYLPVVDDHRQSDDEYEWLPSETKRTRKSKIVDPTYRPEYVSGDSSDESISPTQRRLSRKRKGIFGATTKTVEGQGHLFMRPPKRVKLSSGGEVRVKAESESSSRRINIADPARGHTEWPVTSKGQTLNPTIHPTPSSPVGGLPAKEPLPRSHLVNLKSPIWDFGNSVEPELPEDEKGDRSRHSPKSLKRGRGLSRGADDDYLYLPPSKAVKTAFSKRQPLLTGAGDGLNDDEDDEYEYIDERGVSKNETKGVIYDFSLERAKRWTAAVSLPEDAWSEAEKELFFRLAMRGFEPLLPLHWQHDFSTLPDTMFPLSENEAIPIIRAFKHSDFHGKLRATLSFSFIE